MKILSVVRGCYYGAKYGIEPMFLYFTEPLLKMGHKVETFDHYEVNRQIGRARCTEALINKICEGFDLVLYQTMGGCQPVDTSVFRYPELNSCIVAWNSDDDWQWDKCMKLIAQHFTFMITTYPHIYFANKKQYPNLLLSQWGCYEGCVRPSSLKDIDFSFVGSIYGVRNSECQYLRRRAGLKSFGRGAILADLGIPYFKGAFSLPWIGVVLTLDQVHEIWGRSRISYTPLKGGPKGTSMQVKGRVFEMGLSGSLMLCERNPDVERYYKVGKEYIEYVSMEDCAEKAKYFLSHEKERAEIAANYRRRTLKEHLWEHRFKELFEKMSLPGYCS